MSVKFMQSSNRVSQNINKLAVQRGPIIYAAEEVDNDGPLWNFQIETKASPVCKYEDQLLSGVETISVKAIKLKIDSVDSPLYRELDCDTKKMETLLKLVPYYSWANRAEGQMMVWINR